MTRLVPSLSAIVLLAGCAGSAAPEVDLAKACQVRECSCIETSGGLFDSPDTTDVLWRRNGDAYCPVDHVLRLVPPPPPKPGGVPLS